MQRQHKGIGKIVDFIHEKKEIMTVKLSEENKGYEHIVPYLLREVEGQDRKKLKSLKFEGNETYGKLLRDFALLGKEEKKYQLVGDNGVGMILLSAAAGFAPIHELDLDCRGNIQIVSEGKQRRYVITL